MFWKKKMDMPWSCMDSDNGKADYHIKTETITRPDFPDPAKKDGDKIR